MKKLILVAIFASFGILFLSIPENSKTLQANETDSRDSQNLINTVSDIVVESRSAIRPIQPKQAKASTVNSILKASKLDQYKSQVLGGMKASFNGKVDEKKWNAFAEALSEYPMEAEFENLLKNYSQEELDYLLGHINHPSQEMIKQAQQEKQKELIEVTKLKKEYTQDPEKAEFVDQIFEETKALESTMAISDAVTEPILMAMFKQKNPKANLQEMEAYASKIIEDKKGDTQRVMNNVLLWSFNQVDKATLEDLSQYVRSYSDQNINDKYLADLKILYRRYGRFIGKELTKLYQ